MENKFYDEVFENTIADMLETKGYKVVYPPDFNHEKYFRFVVSFDEFGKYPTAPKGFNVDRIYMELKQIAFIRCLPERDINFDYKVLQILADLSKWTVKEVQENME